MSGTITIDRLRAGDLPGFLGLAAAEGWVAERRELDFLRSVFQSGCFTASEREQGACAYVTALRHGQSGWIGNLIVDPSRRGIGIGEQLFNQALTALQEAGVTTFWLTASSMGKQLYEKFGFESIGTVQRWVGTGTGTLQADVAEPAIEEMLIMDSIGWGDVREPLLRHCLAGGRSLSDKDGFLIVQETVGSSQFGPFSALTPETAVGLFKQAIGTVPKWQKILLDVPSLNRAAGAMLLNAGFSVCSETELMLAGERPASRLDTVYGLATMGSCG